MKRLRIVYFANLKNKVKPLIDDDILISLKKVADVRTFDVKEFKMKELIDKANMADAFLFHANIGSIDEATYYLLLERIKVILDNLKCKKVLWSLEKVWQNNLKTILGLMPKLDYIFLTDETWLRRFESDKMFPLHPAASEKQYVGKFKKELECDVAMVGTLYGGRYEIYEGLKNTYGDKFKLFDNKYGQDFADLCKSAKVIVSPNMPFDDFYWSDRIYQTLANGGFLIHPRTEGLKNEFTEGKHYISYLDYTELKVAIDVYMNAKKDRLEIIKAGQKQVKEITYRKRLKELLKVIPMRLSLLKNEN